ncbi:hypothetical protein XA68_14337 [Ophiocordyceps unilateralis]|uniref:Uncharacterized protein n=1 Tax=Ophiocordyceps unilateralis TaxID=268505 RepID=A0A2A9P9H9_OPHUN|nr:hypothetical protein XA68_14337 [Ophiocordyceps unilateralis]
MVPSAKASTSADIGPASTAETGQPQSVDPKIAKLQSLQVHNFWPLSGTFCLQPILVATTQPMARSSPPCSIRLDLSPCSRYTRPAAATRPGAPLFASKTPPAS